MNLSLVSQAEGEGGRYFVLAGNIEFVCFGIMDIVCTDVNRVSVNIGRLNKYCFGQAYVLPDSIKRWPKGIANTGRLKLSLKIVLCETHSSSPIPPFDYDLMFREGETALLRIPEFQSAVNRQLLWAVPQLSVISFPYS